MKSIANQYRDLKEGKLSQFNFMRNLRMSMPQYVTNTTSFNDAVRILKSKNILTEAMEIQPVPEADEDFSNDTNYDALDAADTEAEELAKAAGSYDAAVGMLQDEMGLSSSAAEAIASRVYPEGGNDDLAYSNIGDDVEDEMPRDDFPMSDYNDGEFWEAKDGDDDAEIQAMINKIAQEMAGEEAVKAQYDITEAKEKVNIETIYPTELSMGIKVEMEHTKDAEKAKKIALDHLAENPFYYTQLALSGVDTPQTEKPKAKKVKAKAENIDTENQMKPVKDVEKVKASANKAKKETNKPVKGISLMSLIAKTVRGVQKMEATGEKMKVVKEGQENYYQTNVRLKPEEQKKIKSVLLDAEFEWDEADRKQVVYSKKSEKEIQNVVDNVTGMATPSSGPKQSGVAKFLTKEDLAKMVREVLAEMESDDEVTADVALGMEETMDGRDNLTDTAGHQLDENK